MKKKILIMLELECKDDTEFRMQYEKVFIILEKHNYKIIEILEKKNFYRQWQNIMFNIDQYKENPTITSIGWTCGNCGSSQDNIQLEIKLKGNTETYLLECGNCNLEFAINIKDGN